MASLQTEADSKDNNSFEDDQKDIGDEEINKLFENSKSLIHLKSVETSDDIDKSRDRELTMEVSTRWYRPPEIILLESKYNFNVDMWSVGCMLSELIFCQT